MEFNTLWQAEWKTKLGHVATATLTRNTGTHHETIRECSGKQCCQADNAATMEHVILRHQHQHRNGFFYLVHAEIGESQHKPVTLDSGENSRVCRLTSPILRLLCDSCPWWRRGWRRGPLCCRSLCSNYKLFKLGCLHPVSCTRSGSGVFV
jgi:hypothetical protein